MFGNREYTIPETGPIRSDVNCHHLLSHWSAFTGVRSTSKVLSLKKSILGPIKYTVYREYIYMPFNICIAIGHRMSHGGQDRTVGTFKIQCTLYSQSVRAGSSADDGTVMLYLPARWRDLLTVVIIFSFRIL